MTGSELHEARFNRGSDARRFSLEGFVVRRVLDSTTLASLRHLFDQIRPRDVEGLTTTTVGRSLEENLAVARQIDAATADGISSVVTGYTPIGATFLAKGPGSGGELTLHQDWTSVDERRSHSMNVWCALGDVGPDHGGLEVISGSHRWFLTGRSPSVPSVQIPFTTELEPYLVRLHLQAGEAVFYDHRLFHGSRPNRTDSLRVTAQVGMAPISEPLVTCESAGGRVLRLVPVSGREFLAAACTGVLDTSGRAGTRIGRVDTPTAADVVAAAARSRS